MRIACVGGGPAGLYFAISAKLRNPEHEIVVLERNRAGDTFGWGVVLSDAVLETLRANDAPTADAILADFAYWDDIEVVRRGRTIRSGGHGFCGIGRMRLLRILQERATELGVELRFESEVDDLDALAGFDLVVAADGANSRIRERFADHFRPDVDLRPNRFVWLGSDRKLDAFEFVFEETEHGPIWIHAYQFEPETSTVITCSSRPSCELLACSTTRTGAFRVTNSAAKIPRICSALISPSLSSARACTCWLNAIASSLGST